MNRRTLLAGGSASLALLGRAVFAQDMISLEVAYAGSMGSMMEGPIKAGAATTLQIAMHGRAQGSDALANLIIGGSISPDVFVPVTPGPMLAVLQAGKAKLARPVARTEMVIAYSPKSKYSQQFADAALGKHGAMPWWQILQQSDIRFGRTDPLVDPQGRNIIFTMQLAETYYKQTGLAQKILGRTINAAQIFGEPTVEARLQSGELDAASAYKIQPSPFNLPYVTLPAEINLGNEAMHDRYVQTSLDLAGKTYRPQSLVYYAAALEGAVHPDRAAAFVGWLAGGAQPIFRQYFYDSAVDMAPLHV
ncbi:MAG: substrate-binding domain-containing protein [Candidatus Eremiobacteraeota bacterium]|nr:substrate-binding domain-containing protein [Candidatus Eremiobacteraeota bacterium]